MSINKIEIDVPDNLKTAFETIFKDVYDKKTGKASFFQKKVILEWVDEESATKRDTPESVKRLKKWMEEMAEDKNV